MAMSNDDIIMPPRSRPERPSQGPSHGPSHGRAQGRGPIIDQDGHEIPDPGLRSQFEAFRFEFGQNGANPFANLTREQRLARLDAIAKLLDVAFACGFNDLSYFNRCFRRRFGLTPTAARGR